MTVTPAMSTLHDLNMMELPFFREYVQEKIAKHRWSYAGLARRAGIATTTLTRMLRRDPNTHRVTHPTKEAVLRALENPDNYVDCSRCHGTGRLAKP